MTIHERAGRRIRTEFVYPPIPLRQFDWSAIDDDTYDGAPDSGNRGQIGRGETEEAAIADLLDILAEEQDRDCTCTYRGLGGNDPDGYVQIDRWCPVHGDDPDRARDERMDREYER